MVSGDGMGKQSIVERESLAGCIERAILLLSALTHEKAKDGDFSLWEIDQMLGEIGAIQDALECAKAQIEEAYSVAECQAEKRIEA